MRTYGGAESRSPGLQLYAPHRPQTQTGSTRLTHLRPNTATMSRNLSRRWPNSNENKAKGEQQQQQQSDATTRPAAKSLSRGGGWWSGSDVTAVSFGCALVDVEWKIIARRGVA
jgi:hypothetical protein